MKLSDGLFLKCARRVAAEYKDIRYQEQIVDAACMLLVTDPASFDVLLLEICTAISSRTSVPGWSAD
jgi:isocitrate dehydrogenase (NAD+)